MKKYAILRISKAIFAFEFNGTSCTSAEVLCHQEKLQRINTKSVTLLMIFSPIFCPKNTVTKGLFNVFLKNRSDRKRNCQICSAGPVCLNYVIII